MKVEGMGLLSLLGKFGRLKLKISMTVRDQKTMNKNHCDSKRTTMPGDEP